MGDVIFEKVQIMSFLKKLDYIFDKKQKRGAAFLMVALTIGAFLELLGVGLIASFVSVLTKPEMIHKNVYASRLYDMMDLKSDHQFFALVTGILILVFVFKNAYLLWLNHMEYKFIYTNQLQISGRLIDCYLKKPYTYHLDKNSAEMVRNVMLDSERFFQMLLSFFLMLTEILVSVFLSVFLLVVDPFITLSMVAILGIFTGAYLLLFKGKTKEYGRINQEYDGRMHQAVNQALGAVKDIKILHREKYFVNEFVKSGEKKMLAVRRNNLLGQAPKYFIEAVVVFAVLVVIMVKLLSGSDINDMIPQLAAFVVAAVKLLPSVSKINNYMNLIIFLKPSADLIYRDIKDTEDMLEFELMDANALESGSSDRAAADSGKENGSDEKSNAKTKYSKGKGKNKSKDKGKKPDDKSSKNIASIRIDHLSYRYPHTERDVIKDVSFEIPLGTSVGFTGESGSGKSTLADVILGILTPTAGHVYYGDMDVHAHPIKWSRKLAYIPQSIYLADESIRANVAFGIEPEDIDDEKVKAALSEAQLLDFVEKLPEGLDTQVGERGVRLSGGQRQRIGIARALYSDPEILVLDEATSALDNETEAAVMEAIERLHGKKTMLIIAHRLSTIENCEMIFHLENGKCNPVG